MIKKYKKLPVVVEAVKWDGLNYAEIERFCLPRKAYIRSGELLIETLEGDHQAKLWDMIIKGVVGECYPCDRKVFEATYEEVK